MRSCLARNSTSLTKEIDSFLTTRLNLPHLWIAEAKALHARYMRQHNTEARLLMAAGLFSESHRTTINHIAPSAIISGQLSYLTTLLNGLQDKNVDGWDYAGQIYLDAIALLRSTKPFTEVSNEVSPPGRNLNEMGSMLSRLVSSLPHMSRSEFSQRVAYHEISAVVMRALFQSRSRGVPTAQKDMNCRNRAIQTLSTSCLEHYIELS